MLKFIKKTKSDALILMILGIVIGSFMVNCTHKDEILITKGPVINRGSERVAYNSSTPSSTAFDKTHGNVNWETVYLGSTAILTGRFDKFGFNTFNFAENNKDSINFDAWVYVNSVNTSEPGRDKGCLQGTFGVDTSMTTAVANVAKLVSKSVEYSTTDAGYIVKCDFTFHGVTKEVTGKLKYMGKTQTTSGTPPVTKDVLGFSFDFQFLAKTDYLLVSNNIADNVTIKCNAIFRRTL
ncbi:MAG: YceI family protein [Chitinophagales bacterium]